ncbi:hypothetical protein OE88DRAFT_448574 [Heliocybe sulcata]|uniref:Peptidase C14 caspase domain-containing protein n=1 Tax=Heliocybe sulcata TaxID=5364 RepID=A0A5C3MVJ2_9AGAM|nr:hypothetical protein OE88DRAFT_448574 [Heliocybe sulcata]
MADASSFHALLVGINDYGGSDLSDGNTDANLECAVPDAERMREFLVDKLSVPSGNVISLHDREATRQNILGTFRSHFIDNPRIKIGDPILFFYAGHGTQNPSSLQEPTEENSDLDQDGDDNLHEAICPADRLEDAVPDIEDRELAKLLMELADRKGDNITVIMDCCHSGSGTRSAPAQGRKKHVARHIPPLRHTRPLATSVSRAPSGYRHVGMKPGALHSHVLLAACRNIEQAYEIRAKDRAGGWFTSQLLKLFSSSSLPTTSYSSLMAKIPQLRFEADEEDEGDEEGPSATLMTVTQTPQCEGKRKDGLLFGGKGLGADRRLVRMRTVGQEIKVEAGSIQGVTPGCRFLVQRGDRFTEDYVGEAVATRVEAVSSYVDIHFGESPPLDGCFARISYRPDPPYCISFTSPASSGPQDVVKAGLEASMEAERRDVDVNLVLSDPQQARLIVTVHGDKMEFTRNWPLLVQHCAPIPVAAVPLESGPSKNGEVDIQKVCTAARFDFYLHHENPDHPYRKNVSAKLYKVRSDRLDRTRDLAEGGVAHLQDDSYAAYALYLESHAGVNLYPAVYYFDPSNHSIQEMYKAPTHNAGAAPLKRALTIGTEITGSPFYFYLEHGEEQDTGFVKIFLSERYAEMKIIEQDEEFEPAPSIEGKARNRSAEAEQDERPGDWDTITLCIKVYRDLASARV